MAKGKIGDVEFYTINNTWKIFVDKENFILKRKGQSDEGEECKNWQTIGFYQTVKQLYHDLVERSIKETSLTDIKAMNNKIQELHQLIQDAHAKGIMKQEKLEG
jgi:hypothetical protein